MLMQLICPAYPLIWCPALTLYHAGQNVHFSLAICYFLSATSHQDINAATPAIAPWNVLPQDSGFPSASTMLLPLFSTTRASAHSPHQKPAAHKHVNKNKRQPTHEKETQNRKEKIMRKKQIMGKEKLNEQKGSTPRLSPIDLHISQWVRTSVSSWQLRG